MHFHCSECTWVNNAKTLFFNPGLFLLRWHRHEVWQVSLESLAIRSFQGQYPERAEC